MTSSNEPVVDLLKALVSLQTAELALHLMESTTIPEEMREAIRGQIEAASVTLKRFPNGSAYEATPPGA